MTMLEKLVGIQPLMPPTGKKYKLTIRSGTDNFELALNQTECSKYQGKHYAVDILQPEVESWLNTQPVHMWKYSDRDFKIFTRVIISEELYTFLVIRWA